MKRKHQLLLSAMLAGSMLFGICAPAAAVNLPQAGSGTAYGWRLPKPKKKTELSKIQTSSTAVITPKLENAEAAYIYVKNPTDLKSAFSWWNRPQAVVGALTPITGTTTISDFSDMEHDGYLLIFVKAADGYSLEEPNSVQTSGAGDKYRLDGKSFGNISGYAGVWSALETARKAEYTWVFGYSRATVFDIQNDVNASFSATGTEIVPEMYNVYVTYEAVEGTERALPGLTDAGAAMYEISKAKINKEILDAGKEFEVGKEICVTGRYPDTAQIKTQDDSGTWKFQGWYLNGVLQEVDERGDFTFIMPAENVTLAAKWAFEEAKTEPASEPEPESESEHFEITYSYSFENDGSTTDDIAELEKEFPLPDPQKCEKGKTVYISSKASPNMQPYVTESGSWKFLGWYVTERVVTEETDRKSLYENNTKFHDGVNVSGTTGYTPTSDITITGRWSFTPNAPQN